MSDFYRKMDKAKFLTSLGQGIWATGFLLWLFFVLMGRYDISSLFVPFEFIGSLVMLFGVYKLTKIK